MSRLRQANETSSFLNAMQTHVDDMRNLVMCKICIRPLYEPFSLGNCGHTYCYSCLSEWFASKHNRRKRSTCPDCRAEVKVQPAPNYLLRELVHMFVSREELLPRDDTLQEHHEAMLAEAQLVETDKRDKSATGGLFKGVFKNASILGQAARAVLRDLEDGVDRCPMCSWELEDGLCNHCGFDAAGSVDFSDDDGQSISTDYDGHGFGDSETDGDMSLQDFDYDGIDYDFDVHHHIRLPIHRDFHHRLEGEDGTTANSAISVTSDSEGDVTPIYGREDEMHLESDDSDDDSDDSSNSSEMRSFIDDDEGDSEDDDATVRTRSPISGFNTYPGNVTVHYNASVTTSATSEDDDSEEEIVTTSRKAPHRTAPRRQRRVVDSDSEDEDVAESTAREGGDDEEVDQLSELHSTASSSPPRAVRGEFLPLESLTSSPPPRSAASRRARRVSQRARSHRRRA